MYKEDHEYSKKLYRLSELSEFKVAKGDEDIRGWDVVTADNEVIGKVDELIVDPTARKVRYIDVDVNEEYTGPSKKGHILIPIGAAALDSKKDIVYAGTVQTVTLLKYPRLEGEINREYETSVRDLLGDKSEYREDQFYEGELYNEKSFFSSRNKLQRLNELREKKMLEVDPDVRGWKVVSKDGLILGRVDDLIADPQQRKIRYLNITVDAEDADVDHNVLIPVGVASVDKNEDRVIVNIERETLLKLPVYDGENITRDYENRLRDTAHFDTLTNEGAPDAADDYYSRDFYNDRGFYGFRGSGVRWI